MHLEPRGSAPRERDLRGGDHPVPYRTRQLSPPSPRVLRIKSAGGQGVALAEGAILSRRATASKGPRGDPPAGHSCVLGADAPRRAERTAEGLPAGRSLRSIGVYAQ